MRISLEVKGKHVIYLLSLSFSAEFSLHVTCMMQQIRKKNKKKKNVLFSLKGDLIYLLPGFIAKLNR